MRTTKKPVMIYPIFAALLMLSGCAEPTSAPQSTTRASTISRSSSNININMDADHSPASSSNVSNNNSVTGAAATAIYSDGKGQYVIYFALDSAALDSHALQVVETLFAHLRAQTGMLLRINGHADTSGSERYNMLLSNDRAGSVKAQMVAMGLPAGQMETYGFGETDLAVPTADETFEPLNRRVEIVVSGDMVDAP